MGYSRESFRVQGYTFTMKPTSPKNVESLFSYLEDSDIDEEDVDQGFSALGKQYRDVLYLIADSEDDILKEDINPEEIDIKKIDYYMQDFLPMPSETDQQQTKS